MMTDPSHTFETIERAAAAVRTRWEQVPRVGIVLGTGLGGLATRIESPTIVPYDAIPGFVQPTVESHAGRLICGSLGPTRVVAMQGRFHRYEGHSLGEVTFPVRVMRALGAEVLVVSNACGGMHPLWHEGDLMLMSDHLNLLGDNPLIGANDPRLGPRFPDMSEPYDADLQARARREAARLGITLREGVYAAVTGPCLETRAEYRMLRTLGADVVGMSTVPEVIVARHAGLRVLGLSIITDRCLPDALQPASLEAIVAVAARAEPQLTQLIAAVVEHL